MNHTAVETGCAGDGGDGGFECGAYHHAFQGASCHEAKEVLGAREGRHHIHHLWRALYQKYQSCMVVVGGDNPHTHKNGFLHERERYWPDDIRSFDRA